MLGIFKRRGKNGAAERLREVLGDYELPAFPSVVLAALGRLRDEGRPLRETAELIAHDPALHVRVLRAVNSAAFGLRHRVTELQHAVSLLGRAALEALLVSVGVATRLPREDAPGYEPARFWRAASQRGSLARALARRWCPDRVEESFTAGLLQDMALPLLAHHCGVAYVEILEAWHRGEVELAEAERERFGWDHGTVAAWIWRSWGLPEELVPLLERHHPKPEPQTEVPVVELVALIPEREEHLPQDRLFERARAWFGVEPDAMEAILDEARQEAETYANFLA